VDSNECIQDRGQIGNARIMGLEEDIGVTDKQFYNCLMLFCMTPFPLVRRMLTTT
jgi:hypothetical protein